MDKGISLVAWDQICRHKEKGAIGLCKIAAVNIAFQCKLASKILTNIESIWTQILRRKYLHNQDFFHTKIKQGDSTI